MFHRVYRSKSSKCGLKEMELLIHKLMIFLIDIFCAGTIFLKETNIYEITLFEKLVVLTVYETIFHTRQTITYLIILFHAETKTINFANSNEDFHYAQITLNHRH